LFPNLYNDVFELQGGEQKSHTIYMNFNLAHYNHSGIRWIQMPLIARSTPEWYARTNAIPYIATDNEQHRDEFKELLHIAVKGENTFFNRREIIDEYGWRNFGELYADHEAVGFKGHDPLVSHYNNQYDCICGALFQFMRYGDLRWFVLADQLFSHVKDIDIYHTDRDRPEFNYGLFWHTEHYIDAKTATHRCFSINHSKFRDMLAYGGGPSLSHNYSTGFSYHFYLTGSFSSKESILQLTSNVINNMNMGGTLLHKALRTVRKSILFVKNLLRKKELIQRNKVYELDGPGRASGNALNTLLDAYLSTNEPKYLKRAEDLIFCCINPNDRIEKRDLLDVENRWMYTVFLQSLGKFLDVKTMENQIDVMWEYARQSLIRYAKWMVKNECLYLEKPEKLEYPNETWVVQDLRKCNVLLYASRYSEPNWMNSFLEKAGYFYRKSIVQLNEFPTKSFARPIAIMMQNGMMYNYFRLNYLETSIPQEIYKQFENFIGDNYILWFIFMRLSRLINSFRSFTFKREIEFIKWRIR